ncbi:MAG TPA: GerMN domain-containing protein [Thermodesulfovibrionales bacterium]|jgi:spore germination protein GerM|nr:GerMN domain-containing protein [Thermodesulfovibrionales bacterium]
MRIDRIKLLWVFVFLLLFGIGIAGGYLFVSKKFPLQKPEPQEPQPAAQQQIDDLISVRIYYPSGGRLAMEERRVRRGTDLTIAEETIEEFLKGPTSFPNTEKRIIPSGAKVLGSYRGSDGILYVNLSDDFRRNFQGDAPAEFLLLKGLYETVISNVKGIDDVKIIVEGKEIESIGGHIFSLYPLKNTLAEAK